MSKPDPVKSFSTFSHYLTAMRNFIEGSYPGTRPIRLRSILTAQSQLTGFASLTPVQGAPLPQVRQLLNNAWQNELALNVPRLMDLDDAYRFSIQWSPVQAYYSVFSLWRTWAVLNGGVDLSTHQKARRTASSVTRNRSLFPMPWGASVSGGQWLLDTTHHDFSGAQIHDVNNIAAPPADADEDWLSKVLRTTRRDFLEDAEIRWKKQNKTQSGRPRQRITAQGRASVRQNLHATTLFDFLYRLRLRSNYDDAADFLYGVLTSADAKQYFWSLLITTDMGQLLLESIIRKQVGAANFDPIANDFLADTTRSRYSLLRRRLAAMQHVNP